ncbi:NADH dehydrogenase subunit J [Magnetococcus marinus MC-1]|uniref:NADH-quinone oxidoreductase subunit J n=1 Tax=Magnetococcus marinus (strain ATCC BAA-1437 / JCM 17883 / MC-1) TaxID=156889 RepID=A0LDR8_MAGMM|nr:NADH-quinone oxidoreductase subunit J [Magnetococcus marinus]ABK46111.1 NADH dehydrogenase subunit J [Magnetococcus marinus MC-1]
MLVDVVFYLLAAIMLVAALRVITAKNPVSSVMFLVLAFFTAAGLFLLIEAEFLAVILVMVYMGAVAILFLFVVMMLDVDFALLRQGARDHLPLGIAVGAVVLFEFAAVASSIHPEQHGAVVGENVNNTLEIGKILYTKYLFPFEVASLILLVALIGAVALAHRKRNNVRTQNIPDQIARTRDESVALKKVKSGEGA